MDTLGHRLSRIEEELKRVSQAVKSIGGAMTESQKASETKAADITQMTVLIKALERDVMSANNKMWSASANMVRCQEALQQLQNLMDKMSAAAPEPDIYTSATDDC